MNGACSTHPWTTTSWPGWTLAPTRTVRSAYASSSSCDGTAGAYGTSAGDGYAPGVISPAVDNLVAQLTRLPGIGTRTAQRLAFHILRAPKDEAGALAAAIAEVKERVRFCRECGNLT